MGILQITIFTNIKHVSSVLQRKLERPSIDGISLMKVPQHQPFLNIDVGEAWLLSINLTNIVELGRIVRI